MTVQSITGGLLRRQRARSVDRVVLISHWVVLMAVVAVTLLTPVLLEERSRLFLLKIALAGALTVLPAWIYFLFISSKGRRLYDEFVINLHRMRIDQLGNLPAPPEHTTYYTDWRSANQEVKKRNNTNSTDNLYRAKFEAIYGPSSVSTRHLFDEPEQQRVRDRTQTFTPVLLTTFLVGIGWALVVQPEAIRGFQILDSFSNLPQVPYEPLRFGFIGAYWFILQDLVRRYYRDDLKTDAFISAAVRLVVVALLVTTIGLIPIGTPEQQSILAFLVGVFPQIGLEVIRASANVTFGKFVPTLRTKYPLSSLDGLTIWDQARLLEEGIEDLENLATANLVDMLLHMRVPVARLVDWLDQAILFIHLPYTEYESLRNRLRAIGIRTATDLEAAWHQASSEGREMLVETLFHNSDTTRADALLTAIGREPNIDHVRSFRRRNWLGAE